jgi:hypothetical protein
MEYKYRTETTVKPLLKWLEWEHTLRNNLLTGESQKTILGADSTWNEKKINKVRLNYINRIKNGKVKVFYFDLVEHTMNEMKKEIDKGPSTIVYDAVNRIFKVNKFLRLCAYYDAIKELTPDYLSPSN